MRIPKRKPKNYILDYKNVFFICDKVAFHFFILNDK